MNIMIKIDIYKTKLALIIIQMFFLLNFNQQIFIKNNYSDFHFFHSIEIKRIFKKLKHLNKIMIIQ